MHELVEKLEKASKKSKSKVTAKLLKESADTIRKMEKPIFPRIPEEDNLPWPWETIPPCPKLSHNSY